MIKNRRNRRYAFGCLSSAEKAISAASSMTHDPQNNGFFDWNKPVQATSLTKAFYHFFRLLS
jgi:hypothetical protein